MVMKGLRCSKLANRCIKRIGCFNNRFVLCFYLLPPAMLVPERQFYIQLSHGFAYRDAPCV
eukprot:9972309-Heterocapsa_arctica.AAC.1